MKVTDRLLSRFVEAQSQLVVQTSDLPLGTLAGMVDAGAIDLEPGFQRRERWKPDKQSALVESFLLNVPVPPIYLAEEVNGKFSAIDGKQRLRAIADFLGNRLKLVGLEKLNEAEGLRFQDLPEAIRNALFLRPYLRVVTLLRQTEVSLKYEVFLRLNRAGESLNDQEIRNVAFRGKLNDAIIEMSKNSFLRERLKIHSEKSSAYVQMMDVQYVLRYLTLNRRVDSFSGELSREMDYFMWSHAEAAPSEIDDLRGLFDSAISRCERIWGCDAFKRPDGNGWRDQLLAGMYDAQMLSVSKFSTQEFEVLAARAHQIINDTRQLFSDKNFEEAVRAGTNTPARIRYRVSRVHAMLRDNL